MTNKNMGSPFDSRLHEEGHLRRNNSDRHQRVLARQVEAEMKAQKVSKADMAIADANELRISQSLA